MRSRGPAELAGMMWQAFATYAREGRHASASSASPGAALALERGNTGAARNQNDLTQRLWTLTCGTRPTAALV
eukprot:1755972-Prymnesium_polylepis.1